MEKMTYEEFSKKANLLFELCPHYEMIILETLRRMEKEEKSPLQNHFKENFQRLKTARCITYERLAQLLTEECGLRIDVNTLKSYSRKDRKSLSSSYSKEIANIFGVSEDMLIYGNDRLSILSEANLNIKNIYNRLSQENKNALYYLVSALYMERIAPEIFENTTYEN